jgi:hypothetical protein
LGACSTLPCMRSLLESEENLVFIKSASSIFFCFAPLPWQCYISRVRSANNANSVSRLCGTKLSPTLVFIVFLRNEDKIPKQPRKIICLILDFCATGISGGISPNSLFRNGLSICSNWSSQQGPQPWYSTFYIRSCLNLRICIEKWCCSRLHEYLSNWIDLVGKSPNLMTNFGTYGVLFILAMHLHQASLSSHGMPSELRPRVIIMCQKRA